MSYDHVVLLHRLIILILTFPVFIVPIIDFTSKKHPSHVQTVSYCFSLGFIATAMVAIWAHSVEAVDKHGLYKGPNGHYVFDYINYGLSLYDEIVIIAALLLLLVLPQLMAYAISGAFGSASKPVLFRSGSIFAFWCIIKSFWTTSGVMVALGVLGKLYRWQSFDILFTLKLIVGALILMCSSSVCIYAYNDLHEAVNIALKNIPIRVKRFGKRLHKCATRNRRRLVVATRRSPETKASAVSDTETAGFARSIVLYLGTVF